MPPIVSISPRKPLVEKLSEYTEDSIPQLQVMKYMGNKRKLLSWLMPIVSEYINDGDTILDLFSGTASVGYALKPRVNILANDIQSYSYVISKALLENNKKADSSAFDNKLKVEFTKNMESLIKIYKWALSDEDLALKSDNVQQYKKFLKSFPIYGRRVPKDIYSVVQYTEDSCIENHRNNPKKFPYNLFTTYYTNTFFGLRQSIEIDSLRYSIDTVGDKNEQSVYLSCLMYALSNAVNSSGHFAEYLNTETDRNIPYIMGKRRTSIVSSFLKKLKQFEDLYTNDKTNNKVYQSDYKDLIKLLSKDGTLSGVDLIYIDPPYTGAQYSRFYHIPETLVKYDYPQVTLENKTGLPVKGGYRNDRTQSSFCLTSRAKDAFQEMFKIISENCDATLAISYSDNSILKPVNVVTDLANQYYNTVEKINGYAHSAQGSRFKRNGQGRNVVNEYLIICKKK